MLHKIKTPLKKSDIRKLRSGDEVIFSGIIYTARDQAHKKLLALIKNNKKLPFDLKDQAIYYCGPTATPKGKIIGSCGPTTSSRMDEFIEPFLVKGLLIMIGKGRRSKNVRASIKKHAALYLIAPAGCGALLARKVFSNKLIAFPEFGPEAIRRLEVKDFPLIVAIDAFGDSIYPDL